MKYNSQEFYDLMYADCEGFIEVRQMKKGRVVERDWVKPEEMSRFSKPSHNEVYFGCCTRKKGVGTKEGVLEVPFLWADMDFKDTSEDEAEKILKECIFEPTITVNSGGGFHIYWKLKEPYQIEKPEDIYSVESVLKRLAASIKADMAATDITRVLRVPGSLKKKQGPPRDAYISYISGRDGKC